MTETVVSLEHKLKHKTEELSMLQEGQEMLQSQLAVRTFQNGFPTSASNG